MKLVVLSSHAETALRERAIEIEWVTRTLSDPDRVEVDRRHVERSHMLKRIPEFGGRWLRVVHVETADQHRIVTVFFDRHAGREVR